MLDELLSDSKDESVPHAAGSAQSDETPGCSHWTDENPHEPAFSDSEEVLLQITVPTDCVIHVRLYMY